VQGAIQLGLAHHGEQFEAEVFGFNLGYEQLPLHLLITAYEPMSWASIPITSPCT
jgi:hypothetical protein